jgi:hypothetical protein
MEVEGEAHERNSDFPVPYFSLLGLGIRLVHDGRGGLRRTSDDANAQGNVTQPSNPGSLLVHLPDDCRESREENIERSCRDGRPE